MEIINKNTGNKSLSSLIKLYSGDFQAEIL